MNGRLPVARPAGFAQYLLAPRPQPTPICAADRGVQSPGTLRLQLEPTVEDNAGATLYRGGGIALVDAVVIALAVASAALLCAYHLRRLRIAEFARGATRGSASQRDIAFALASAIFGQVKRGANDPPFLLPLLAPLGGSPVAILKKGACCSGVHRLYITSLDTLGIRAAQVTVFRSVDPAHAHCLAQVTVESANLLIDVDYGVWLRHPNEGPIDLLGLRTGVTPAVVPFVLDREACYANGARPRAAGYPDGDYYRFDFCLARTANWAETRLKRAVYGLLRPVTGGRVDCLLLPAILEWPEVLLAGALCGAAILLLAARALVH